MVDRTDVDIDADGGGPGADDVDGLGVTIVGDEHGGSILRTDRGRHGDGFRRRRGFVQQRRVRQRQPGQFRHDGLEVQQRFQTALGDLRLVRRVLRVPGGVFQHVPLDHRRRQRAMVPHPDERPVHAVATGQFLHRRQHLALGAGGRQIEVVTADRFRHASITQIIKAREPQRGQHSRLAVRIRSEVPGFKSVDRFERTAAVGLRGGVGDGHVEREFGLKAGRGWRGDQSTMKSMTRVSATTPSINRINSWWAGWGP